MTEAAAKGITKARAIYHQRSKRAQELQAEGKKVIGYLCLHPAIEMLTALDLVPYRLLGDIKETITRADIYLPAVVCPFLRNLLDMGLKGRYSFLDGVVMAHTCDVGAQIPGLWNSYVRTPFSYFIDTPHTLHAGSLEQEKGELEDFRKGLETLTGKELTARKLQEAIAAHNLQRELVRNLYELKKNNPPLISGVETHQVIVAMMSLPVEEGNQLLTEVLDDIRTRRSGPAKKAIRLLIWGPVISETPLIEMIESMDANIVMDDTCIGSRAYFGEVKSTSEPLDGLANYYLKGIRCPRTFVENDCSETRKDHAADLESRFGYLGDYVRKWGVQGVILQSVRYCDSHGFEVPAVKEYFDRAGVPTIYLEHNNTEGALAPLKTRVQGFLEVIEQ